MNHDMIENLFAENQFILNWVRPFIAVFRETAPDKSHVQDTGDNCCDVICICDSDSVTPLLGRSIPHKKYQAAQIAGTGACNRIASGWYPSAFRPGNHTPYGGPQGGWRALIQNSPLVVWRSIKNHDWGDADDIDQNLQPHELWDNVHGFAPDSAGCITIMGAMNPPAATGHWKAADDWIYRKHASVRTFGLAVFEHVDLERPGLRIGSSGHQVEALQRLLGIEADGVFGPQTFRAVRAKQLKSGLHDDGVWREG